MATKINVTRCAKRNDATALSSVTCNSATAGAAQDYTLTFDGADDHSGIIVHNAGTKDITVKLSDADRKRQMRKKRHRHADRNARIGLGSFCLPSHGHGLCHRYRH